MYRDDEPLDRITERAVAAAGGSKFRLIAAVVKRAAQLNGVNDVRVSIDLTPAELERLDNAIDYYERYRFVGG